MPHSKTWLHYWDVFYNSLSHIKSLMTRAERATFMLSLLPHVFCFTVVSLGQFISFSFSFHYVQIPGFVIWYFPLGFQFLIFIFLPYRYWGTAVLAICIASGATVQYQGSIYYDLVRHFVLSICMILPVLPIIYYVRTRHLRDNLFSLKSIVYLVFLGMLLRLNNIGFYFLSNTSVYDRAPQGEKFAIFLQHNLAAYPGILLAVCLFLVVQWVRQKRTIPFTIKLQEALCLLTLLTALMIILFAFTDTTHSVLKITLFLPIVWMGYKYSWFGSLLCATWINIVLWILLYDAPSQVLISFQPFLIAYFLLGLVTAALQFEHSASEQALLQHNVFLDTQQSDLQHSRENLQKLASKLVSFQEQERKYLSQELHDDVGQNIIALRTLFSVANRQSYFENCKPELLQRIKNSTDEVYDTAYNLMHWLRPRIFDEVGLYGTISGEFLKSHLYEQHIKLTVHAQPDIDTAPELLKMSALRVIQTSIDNVLQHSRCSTCSVSVKLKEQQLLVTFHDDGQGFPEHVLAGNYGTGLSTIDNIVLALGGKLTLNNDPKACIHAVFPF
ncbi:MAG: ATP-binding protein [Glaciecola sp.]|jgi:two-component system sensor histidine kinase UhpB